MITPENTFLKLYTFFKEAVSLLEQVVKIWEQTLAKDHPDRLASQYALFTEISKTGAVDGQIQAPTATQ
jgi:hypothetical protein